jgi:glycosyltransferase involved in cell wall biosynthesis
MKILAVSHSFLPSLGGIETTTDALARAWAAAGHEVTIATQTPGDEAPRDERICILRRSSPGALLQAARRADLVWHNHLSLRAAWTQALAPRPWVVTHQGWLRRSDGALTPGYRLKRLVARAAHSVAISKAIAADLPAPATVIPNPYRDRLFRNLQRPRPYELAFLGRLVTDKGAALLLEALARVRAAGNRARLLVIGSGPEEPILKERVGQLGLAGQVVFAGALDGEALVKALNSAAILVVPSLYDEPFGIVALEGIACGCAVIASAGGGLPEAVGPCGLTFPNGDAERLAASMAQLVASAGAREQLTARAPDHLRHFTTEAIAARYLRLFQAAAGNGR